MPRFITSREDLETVISGFNPDNHTHGKYASGLPSHQTLEDYHKRKAAGQVFLKDETPYENTCTSFTEAYYDFLSKQDIAVISVNNSYHEYLLIPILQNGKIEVVIFDPSAEQMFYGLAKPYFIGTAAELKGLEATDPNIKYLAYLGKSLVQSYFSRIMIQDINITLPEDAVTPALLELFEFAPEQISILTGVVKPQTIRGRQKFYDWYPDLVFEPAPELVGDVVFSQADGRTNNIDRFTAAFSTGTQGNLISVSTYVRSGDLEKLRSFMTATGIFPCIWGSYGHQDIYEFDGDRYPHLLQAVNNSRCNGSDFASRHKKRNPLVPDGTSMSRKAGCTE